MGLKNCVPNEFIDSSFYLGRKIICKLLQLSLSSNDFLDSESIGWSENYLKTITFKYEKKI